jgi:hypothetical protein
MDGETLVWSGFFGSVEVADCNREQIDVAAFETLFARLSGRFYANVSTATTAVRGPYLSETCADAAAYDLAFASGDANIGVAVSRQPDTPLSVYLRFNVTSPATVAPTARLGSFSVCPSCDFTQAGCQPLPSSGPPPTATTAGPFLVRWEVPAGPQPVLNMSFSASPM